MMNCVEVRSYLPLLTLAVPEDTASETVAARLHVQQCPGCRAVLDELVASDQTLARQMQSVAVPAQLKAVLLERLAPQPTWSPATKTRRNSTRRLWLSAAMVLLLMGFSTPFFWRVISPVQISVTEVRQLIESRPDASVASGSPRRDRPAGWQAVGGLVEQSAIVVPGCRISHVAVTCTFQPSRRAEAQSCLLWMADRSRIQDAQRLSTLEAAEIQYSPQGAWLVWSENDVVYLLDGEASVIRSLVERLKASRRLA